MNDQQIKEIEKPQVFISFEPHPRDIHDQEEKKYYTFIHGLSKDPKVLKAWASRLKKKLTTGGGLTCFCEYTKDFYSKNNFKSNTIQLNGDYRQQVCDFLSADFNVSIRI